MTTSRTSRILMKVFSSTFLVIFLICTALLVVTFSQPFVSSVPFSLRAMLVAIGMVCLIASVLLHRS